MASLLALFFRMDFRAILPGFVKSTTEILIEIVLDLWIYLEDNWRIIILSIAMHKYRIFLFLFMSLKSLVIF